MKTNLQCVFFFLLCLLFANFFTSSTVLAQTPGLIYRPATSGGQNVLDPNGDGYVSATSAGWASGARDEGVGFSEIPYRAFPALQTEPLNDLTTGSGGGHTDLAPPNADGSTTGAPLAAYFNETHLLFRVRIGSASTASKGYSVLIDSNNSFNTQSTAPNPGFEFEVVLATNFDVAIYDHRNAPNGGPKVFSGSVSQFSQRSVAASLGGGNPDYFYDFYVPLSAFPAGAITATTPLRMTGITVTSAQSGITGTVSDVGGVNYASYSYNRQRAWSDVISSFPPTSLNQIQAGAFPILSIAAAPPVVRDPITAVTTTITGISVEAPGSIITAYKTDGGTTSTLGTTTVLADGSWTLTGIPVNSLTLGNTITATVKPPNKDVSPLSEAVIVTSGFCFSIPPPVITALGGTGNNNRPFIGTTSYVGSQRIRIYSVDGNNNATFIISHDVTTTAANQSWETPAVALGQFNYFATTTPLSGGTFSGCESLRSNQLCWRNGPFRVNGEVVSITSAEYTSNNATQSIAISTSSLSGIPVNTTTILGSVAATPGGSVTTNVILIVNSVPQSQRAVPVITSTTAAVSWSLTLPALQATDIINVRTVRTLTGGGSLTCENSYSSPSNLLDVQNVSEAPTINALTECGRVTRLTGTSTEPAGTTIQFFTGGTAGQRNGTIVNQNGTSTPITARVSRLGTWSADLSSAAGGGIGAGTAITARALIVGEVRSVNSNVVTGTTAPTAPVMNGPINEGSTTIIGRGAAPGSQVTLIIDGTPFTPVTATQDGNFIVSGLSEFEVFAGASITATYTTTGGTCVSERATPVIVQCAPPATPAFTTNTFATCSGGTVSLTLNNTVSGVSYALVTRSGTAPNFTYTSAGSSLLSTGGTITLTSNALTAGTILYVRARRISGATCDAISTNTITVTVNPVPVTTGLPASTTTSLTCPGVATVSVSGTNASYNYQLVNSAGALVGSPVQGSGTTATISLSAGTVSAPSSFSLRINDRTTGCITTVTNFLTVTLTSSPTLNNTVTNTSPIVCTNAAGSVTVNAPQAGYTYQLYNVSTNMAVGTGVLVQSTNTPSSITLSTGTLGAGSHTFYVGVRSASGTCTGVYRLNTQVTVNAQPGPTATSSWQTQCGGNLTINLSSNTPTTGGGTWTVSTTTSSTLPTITSPTSATTTATGLNSGNFVFTWTANTSCTGGTSTANVTVTVNCPTEYLLAAPRYKTDYTNNTVLASAFDPDGGVKSASLAFGNLLPDGTSLLPNGNIVVNNAASLMSGTYSFTVLTTDARNITTSTPMTIQIYGEAPTTTSLPVELVYFTATVQQGQATLQWLTASEKDNDRFEIERSTDGRKFEKIGTVTGKGNTNLETKYSFLDKKPVTGTVYYRLKQIDYDGQHEYSQVIAVNGNGVEHKLQLQAHPSPFNNLLHVTVTAPVAERVTLQLADMKGRVLLVRQLEINEGLNQVELKLKDIAGGVYLLKVSGNGMQASTRVMKTQ
ncbi:T9SS type A sorting domain-containing protein [Pontibacter sp. 13R65]|uniref:T9SS type A sorting domain-containing protein n=1 Tax=Pontibacter sp. 13R65 TaxID=3127458 RepID=UPI00301D2589